jgi:hypothetical protein
MAHILEGRVKRGHDSRSLSMLHKFGHRTVTSRGHRADNVALRVVPVFAPEPRGVVVRGRMTHSNGGACRQGLGMMTHKRRGVSGGVAMFHLSCLKV